MKTEENSTKYFWVTFGLVTFAIIAYVLFQYPQPGIADQGDFDRVMLVSGLELTADHVNDPNFVRFLDYIVTDYKISEVSIFSPLSRVKATSISYIITLISLLCKICGQDTFKTGYLAIAYLMMYVFALYVIIRFLNIENRIKLTLLVAITLLVFLDGNYLVWFNSLYGEPMMITTLLLYLAAWIYYIDYRFVLKLEDKVFSKIVLVYAAAFLFLGSKIQVISALPIILFMLAKLFWENRHLFKQFQVGLLCILFGVLIVYPIGLYQDNKEISKDTQYDSVFYGILKDSKNPAQDLIDMGLNPDMAVDAGKHAFLAKGEYIKYVPHTQITQEEFYSKMNNAKLVKFYLTHPGRLIKGMEYTASQSLLTSSFLGKYQREYSETPVREFNRFTMWSSFREHQVPRNLLLLVTIYAVVLTVTLVIYFKNKSLQVIIAKVHLLWGIMVIGLLQFPMPFMGNGQADTSKQLYLFNFIFDVILVVSVYWCLNRFIDFCYLKKSIGKSLNTDDITQLSQLNPTE